VISFADSVRTYNKGKRDPSYDDGMYNFAITHPDVLKAVPDSDFLHKYAGSPYFKELAEYRGKLQGKIPVGTDAKNNPGNLSYETINRVVDSRLLSMGVDPKDKDQAGHIGAVRRTVNNLIAAEQRRVGRPLTDTETEAFVDRQFARPGVINTKSFLGIQTSQTKLPLFAVDVNHIPADDLKQIDDALDRIGQPKTDANRLALYYSAKAH